MISARIFFIFPHFIMNSDKFVECDFKDHLYDSAVNVGATGAYFWGDPISYPGLNPPPFHVAQQKLAECREAIFAFKPDFLVYDACFNGSDATVNRSYLAEIKRQTGCKLIGFMADAWGENWKSGLGYWGEVTDRLIYITPPHGGQEQYPKLMSIPYPVNTRNFFPDEKDTDVSFFGTGYEWRKPFLNAAVEICQQHGWTHNIRGHGRFNDCPDMAEYGRILRRSRVVFNLSMRHNGLPITTGRVWQAINSGCLLLEEKNPETPFYFTPGEHYIEFTTPDQLKQEIERSIIGWSANPMPKRAYDYCQDRYGTEAIWQKIIGGL